MSRGLRLSLWARVVALSACAPMGKVTGDLALDTLD